ncbi:MAG: tetratricopeptide repeat protein, partial [Candidatus Dormibacteria bacterium]
MTAAGGPLSRGWATLAAILVLAATAAAACDRGSTRAHPPPSPAVAGGALGRADVLLFKGDYLGAEAGYRKLAGGGDAHARAHLALLLAYESRYQESLAVAQQAVAARSDSEDLAILTRARDWAQDYDGALQSGAAALRAKPVSPLAHPFYAEVLADSGLYTAARRQLRLGQASARDRYARSEVDREWANLYRDEGDTAQELNYFQLSQRAQPAFPERTLELVRYEYQVGRSSAARTLLAGLQKRDSHAYWALESGAEAAQYLDGDATQATKLYQAALRAAPGAPTASLGLAELAANAHHFRAAHDLLLPVLKAHPDAGDVYLFLRYLDQLVLHIDPSADLASASSSAATQLAAAQAEALDRVNGYRVAAGLSPIPAGPGLAQGAEAHAYYVLFNWGAKQLAGLGIHSEAPSLPGFTGVNGLDRSRHFGYRGSRSSEVIDHVESPASAVETWVDAVYH